MQFLLPQKAGKVLTTPLFTKDPTPWIEQSVSLISWPAEQLSTEEWLCSLESFCRSDTTLSSVWIYSECHIFLDLWNEYHNFLLYLPPEETLSWALSGPQRHFNCNMKRAALDVAIGVAGSPVRLIHYTDDCHLSISLNSIAELGIK
jgi:hypothetical protein